MKRSFDSLSSGPFLQVENEEVGEMLLDADEDADVELVLKWLAQLMFVTMELKSDASKISEVCILLDGVQKK